MFLNSDNNNNPVKPFIKWAGGKKKILEILLRNKPEKFNRYYEPFVGGGALFFSFTPANAFLSDINLDLVITYNMIKKRPYELIEKLKEHKKKHNENYYYKIRKQFDLNDSLNVAARFIYLNKTCYNGLYRVNNKGEFNVPFGDYKEPLIVDEKNIIACSNVLKNVEIFYKDFSMITPSKDDFVYIDPPYHPIDSTSFTKYTKLDFTEADQIRLYKYCHNLNKQCVKFMLSNSDTQFIRNLYKDFDIKVVDAPRSISCKSNGREKVKEVLIKNF